MNDDELLAQVRQLRERGCAPKQIAKALRLRPSAVAPLVRQIAELEQKKSEPSERALLGCWVNPGWSCGLGLTDAPQWAAADPVGATDPDTGGLAAVLIARQERASRVTVCGFLIDVYCLGVKNVVGPEPMGAGSVDAYRRAFFEAYDAAPITIPVELAQHLVHGAVAYARGLGFEPPADFATAASYLGTPSEPTPIDFGREGKPYYISGPYDNPRAVLETLRSSVGDGNYHYLTHL
ncbi:hypothetical protein [Allorhizocola rhizosphaerae]|uniref:hypothetical protein n=1 Tax=Allorhizocola rhizosphaerae TaxID=1872709 RepID=UPI000E3DCB23|nr:hypothetical protein [Allorhizocola rhizosphaerae]